MTADTAPTLPPLPEPVAWRGLTQFYPYPQDNDWRYGPWVYDLDPAKFKPLFTADQMHAYATAHASAQMRAIEQALTDPENQPSQFCTVPAAHATALAQRVAELEREVERLRADAERYRWLRGQHWSTSPLCVVLDPKDAVKLGRACPSGDLLDDAIDAARKGVQHG